MSKAAAADTARVFFALWPNAAIQRALGALAQDLGRECGGRAPPPRHIHLTLVFLGDVARDRIVQLEALAAGISSPCFELGVDRIEFWRHNRIVWAGVEFHPEALQELAAQIQQGLSRKGFHFDKRPYVPHITLLRNARRAPAAKGIERVPWTITGFALVESVRRERGREYERLHEWALGRE